MKSLERMRYKKRIDALERELDEMRLKPTLRHFGQKLGEAIVTLLANTPYSEWPNEAKIAFRDVEEKFPIAAFHYMERLPKE